MTQGRKIRDPAQLRRRLEFVNTRYDLFPEKRLLVWVTFALSKAGVAPLVLYDNFKAKLCGTRPPAYVWFGK